MEELQLENWLELIEEGKFATLRTLMHETNPADIAEFFEEVPVSKQLLIFRLLSKDNGAEVFSFLDSDMQERIVSSITDNEIRVILDELSIDDAVDFLSEVPANIVTRVLKNTDEETRKLINQFLNYPEDSAGSVMTIEYMQLHPYQTAKQAIEHIKKTGFDKETIYSCYVTDSRKVLIGSVSLRNIVLSQDDVTIDEIMEDDVIFVRTLDDREEATELIKKYDFIALPVVDNENRLVGIITVDDIVDVIEEENTEDMEKMAALIPSEDEYLKTSVWELAKNRVPWLLVLMISGTISSYIIGKYEFVLSSVVVLSTYFTILMGTGGNAGNQASTLIIRGMSVGEIETSDIIKVLMKELGVGLISGICLCLVNFLRLIILKTDIWINLTVSLSMIFTVVAAKAIGCSLPIVAKKLNADPAIMAGPLITTIVDAVSLIIFFNLSLTLVL